MVELPKGTGGFLSPQKALDQLEINAASKIADFGCGHGYFAIPLAKMVGQDGQIYAVDVLQDALNEVKERAERENLSNIQTVRGNLEAPDGSRLPENSCDMVLLANVLFQSNKKADIIKEARRVLKSNGKMIIVDWHVTSEALTLNSGWRIGPQEAQGLAESQNFSFERTFDAGDYHYGLIFKKF